MLAGFESNRLITAVTRHHLRRPGMVGIAGRQNENSTGKKILSRGETRVSKPCSGRRSRPPDVLSSLLSQPPTAQFTPVRIVHDVLSRRWQNRFEQSADRVHKMAMAYGIQKRQVAAALALVAGAKGRARKSSGTEFYTMEGAKQTVVHQRRPPPPHQITSNRLSIFHASVFAATSR